MKNLIKNYPIMIGGLNKMAENEHDSKFADGYLAGLKESEREMSSGMKIAIGTLVTGALIYFGYNNFGSPFRGRDYMNAPRQTQSQQTQRQVPQSYIPVNPNFPQNNSSDNSSDSPNGYSVIDTNTRTRNEFRKGGKYNYKSSSTNQSQTIHSIVPNTSAYAIPQTKTSNYPKPCERAIPLPPVPNPPRPVPQAASLESSVEVVPTPSPLEEKTQGREY